MKLKDIIENHVMREESVKDIMYYDLSKDRYITYEDEQERTYQKYKGGMIKEKNITKCLVCYWANNCSDYNKGKCSEYHFLKSKHNIWLKIYNELNKENAE